MMTSEQVRMDVACAATTQLSESTLRTLPSHVRVPSYDRRAVTPGILHLGANNFSMAHLGSIIDDVLGRDPSWGIVATSIRSNGVINSLQEQDNLYVLMEREGTDCTARVLGPIINSLFGPDSPEQIVNWMADERIRLVTVCVSNHGYYLTGTGINLGAPDIEFDLQSPAVPRTIYGYLLRGLEARAKTGKPLTIVSLDNVAKNSISLKKALLQFLQRVNPTLARWVEENCDFPVTTVDRITPKVADPVREEYDRFLGFSTRLIVATERFRQLVVEKSRYPVPPWEDVDGVKTVDNCQAYWQSKFFVLNAGHQVIGITAQRMGYRFIHEAARHPQVAQLLERYHGELTRVLPGDEAEISAYAAKIRRRFLDESLGDTVVRVTARTTSKVSERVLAAVEKGLWQGTVLTVPVFVTAVWMLNLGGKTEDNTEIAREDADAPKLVSAHAELVAWLEGTRAIENLQQILVTMGELLGDARFGKLAQSNEFVQELAWALQTVNALGVVHAVEALLAR